VLAAREGRQDEPTWADLKALCPR